MILLIVIKGVSILKVFKGHIVKKCGLAGRTKSKLGVCGPHFCINQIKKLVILGYFLILKVVECRTYHVGEPHADHEMPV